jgi:hypothetical protein
MTNIIATIETDVSAFLTNLAAPEAAIVQGVFSTIKSGSFLENLAIQAIPQEEEGRVLTFCIYLVGKLEAVAPLIPAGNGLGTLFQENLATLSAAVNTKAGSSCLKAFGTIVTQDEAYFKTPAAPTPETAIAPATKAVAIKAAVAAPPTLVINPDDWAAFQAWKTQQAVNAAADAPLAPIDEVA